MNPRRFYIAVIGAGPAGLMAAEVLAGRGCAVTVYDRMPSPGRKFLMAGRGGLNLTHSESLDAFLKRYGSAEPWLAPMIKRFPPDALRQWCEELGQPTFVGTSGRIFPTSFKATPVLRAWLARLEKLGVEFKFRHRWNGWAASGKLAFEGPEGPVLVKPDATLLALGGGSWPRLGSDGKWMEVLAEQSIQVSPLRPANCGFEVTWSKPLIEKYVGQPVKPLCAQFGGAFARGEAMITEKGIEGGAIYALSSRLRDAIERDGSATLVLDLLPGVAPEQLEEKLRAPQKSQSRSTFLRKAAKLSPVSIALVQEVLHRDADKDVSPERLARLIKSLPVILTKPFPLERAISSAGGLRLEALDGRLMLKDKPGVFAAGEMLDWEAPTGGYLLQASFSTGVAAAHGIMAWLEQQENHNLLMSLGEQGAFEP